MTSARPWPGRPSPLGATWDGEGTGFALFSASAEAVDLCLFDASGAESRVRLQERTGDVWHGYLAGVGPGQEYGYRVHGPYDPANGKRHDGAKLLSDPYARALTGGYVLHDAVFEVGQESAPHVPRSVVVHDDFDWGDDRRPGTAWAETVVYEMHVKGYTARHPGVPEQLRGTYAGLAHPAAIEHLTGLGVTAVELLPVHHFVSEPHLLRRGLTNYWGYNTLGYFAPHAGYSSSGVHGQQVGEFKAMVRALHEAGIEVLLDVVYNHTAEGDETGPTLSMRGIDNESYYRLLPEDRARYRDYTGCGNTLDLRVPHVLQLVMDSLRYWVQEMHVDGFRFDLASALVRGGHEVDLLGPFLQAVQQDPALASVKLVAEPWDVGEGGYQVGRFPAPWAEWNDRYRDAGRDSWRGSGAGARELASRLSGSSDLFGAPGRAPWASVNFVTAHDGFSLRDLTSYEHKHNEANGESNRDGESHNRSWNCGVEGETDDAGVNALRRRQARNLLATLLLSSGVPMMTMGDELRRTQRGNNNAYCQDGELSHLSWEPEPGGDDLMAWVSALLALRRDHPVLRQRSFFTGQAPEHRSKDIVWFAADGAELGEQDWFDPALGALGMYVNGAGIAACGPRGEPVVDDSFLVVLHLAAEDSTVVLPPVHREYDVLLDTTGERPAPGPTLAAGEQMAVRGRSVLVLRAR